MAEVDLKTKLTVSPVITGIKADSDKRILLRWKAVPLAEKYDIKRSFTSDGEFVHIDWATGTEFTDETAEADTTYWYKVVAWKRMEAKKTSKKESTVKMVVASDVPCAENFSAASQEGEINLSWVAQKGYRYRIFRRNTFFSHSFCIGESSVGSFTDDKAVSGQVYCYSVQTILNGEEKVLHGNITDEISCAFIDTAEIAVSKKIWGRAFIELNIVAGADGYIFERSNSKDGEFVEVGRTDDITAVSFEEKLPSGLKAYYYRARAYKKSADEVFYGKYSDVKPVR